MDIANVLGLVIALGLAMAFLLLIWSVLIRRRTQEGKQLPKSLEAVTDARLEEGERPAELVSEQIEEMVRQQLAGHADLAGIELDFATAADGSLHIWFQGQEYSAPEDIPDERVRKAIQQSVKVFNR